MPGWLLWLMISDTGVPYTWILRLYHLYLVQPHAQPFFPPQHETLPDQLDVRRQQIFEACAEHSSPAQIPPTYIDRQTDR